jgi:hypothetical protein
MAGANVIYVSSTSSPLIILPETLTGGEYGKTLGPSQNRYSRNDLLFDNSRDVIKAVNFYL